MGVLLGIGTRKGLWLATSEDRREWDVRPPLFPVADVRAFAIDTRGNAPRLLAAAYNEHFGLSVFTSDDLGENWSEPEHAPVAFPADTEEALEGVWQLVPGNADEPGVVYAGVEPSALFRSEDGGRSFELVRGLWDHPHRKEWTPGGGGKAIHTVIPHPTDHRRMTVAMSTGGVYRTADGGASWQARNKGIGAGFLPDEEPEFGQCVHKVAMNPAQPERYFLQNHGGVYRSDDDADTWTSIADGLPADFGFPVVVHPHKPEVVYNFPLQADVHRFTPDARCRVYRSEDAGKSWNALGRGLPEDGFYSVVLRDAMCTDDAETAGVYFGTRSGEVWASADEGENWASVARNLPDVLCVRAAVV
ncbi:glycosyl hydrolase [Amycolatopsis antarctica]|uniref:Glycosyl hydrolase n=1 Tax=Amycolatopsis antarctica TaxID=1854586 RepID=A0A263CXR3_9PSEU|nr:sialidase family protein [Amycolatopsis antarctica]OZM70933.1 glycosyl hydrolase [Amycolatopsis antarctica]